MAQLGYARDKFQNNWKQKQVPPPRIHAATCAAAALPCRCPHVCRRRAPSPASAGDLPATQPMHDLIPHPCAPSPCLHAGSSSCGTRRRAIRTRPCGRVRGRAPRRRGPATPPSCRKVGLAERAGWQNGRSPCVAQELCLALLPVGQAQAQGHTRELPLAPLNTTHQTQPLPTSRRRGTLPEPLSAAQGGEEGEAWPETHAGRLAQRGRCVWGRGRERR